MNTFKVKMNLAVFLALVLGLAACSHTVNARKDDSASNSAVAGSDQYATEIVELNHVVRQNSRSADAKKAHLKLAKLYSDHNNRRRNYDRALKHLEAYVILENSVADDETMDWMAALKEINRLSKEITQVKKQLKKSNTSRSALTKTNRKLTREEIKLRKKTVNLKNQIKSLKKLSKCLKNSISAWKKKDEILTIKHRPTINFKPTIDRHWICT